MDQHEQSGTAGKAAPLYIGYGYLEGWLEAVDPERPVYAGAFTRSEPHPEHPGLELRVREIICAQPAGEGEVHYCILETGGWVERNGEPNGSRAVRMLAMGDQPWGLVLEWLRANGLHVREAAIDFPHGYVRTRGRARFLVFDAETFTWRVQDGATAAELAEA